jgi:hypothetical protein
LISGIISYCGISSGRGGRGGGGGGEEEEGGEY